MSALIGALRVSLSADTANFDAGMRRAQGTAAAASTGIQKSLGGLKAGVAGLVAGLSVGMFVRAIEQALEYAGSLAEVGQQLGVTAKDLQTFRFAAGQVGVEQDQLETGLSKLTITLGKVAAGAKAPADALKAIGISASELKGKDTGEAFRLIADGLEKVTDRSQRAAVEVALFGKTGSKLDNLLSGGSAALNELTDAAEKLGIVLSDEQIQKADATADKLRALKTVLSARIAGVVADNADAILGFADSLVYLVGKVGDALQALGSLRAWFSEQEQLFSIPAQLKRAAGIKVNATGLGQVAQNGGSVTLKLPPARPFKPPPPAGGDIEKFLAGGGGGKSKKGGADHSAEDALRERSQFDQDVRRAQMDVLRAQQDLAKDYVERTTIGIEILNAEKAARDAEHEYQIALYELTKGKQGQSAAQVAQIKAQEDIKDSLEREKLLQDEEEQRQRDVQELTAHDHDRRRDVLQSQAQIASTAAERRQVELQLLELAYEAKRQALQHIVDTDKDEKAKEDARRDLVNLNQTHDADKQGVINSTRGPLEDWAASVPKTAAQINEALQSIEAQGLDSLVNSIDVADASWAKFGESFKSIGLDMLTMLVRLGAKMLIVRALSGIFGGGAFGGTGADAAVDSGIYGNIGSVGLPGFAGGGSFNILGRKGTDKNVLSVNGVRIANVSHGERINIANDGVNGGGGPAVIVHQHNNFAGGAVTQTDLLRMHQVTVAASTKAINEQRRRG